MELTRETIEQVARLAQLSLAADQVDALAGQLGRILHYVDQLAEVDTEGVEPMAHAVPLANVFAPDQLEEGLDRSAALANAPHHDDECFLVPPVLGEGSP